MLLPWGMVLGMPLSTAVPALPVPYSGLGCFSAALNFQSWSQVLKSDQLSGIELGPQTASPGLKLEFCRCLRESPGQPAPLSKWRPEWASGRTAPASLACADCPAGWGELAFPAASAAGHPPVLERTLGTAASLGTRLKDSGGSPLLPSPREQPRDRFKDSGCLPLQGGQQLWLCPQRSV